mgnify:CR=1 FL=1
MTSFSAQENAALAQPVLSHVALGYSPMIDRQRAVVATRVTVVPERPDSVPDAHDLIAALLEVWPAPADAGSTGAMPESGGDATTRLDPDTTEKWSGFVSRVRAHNQKNPKPKPLVTVPTPPTPQPVVASIAFGCFSSSLCSATNGALRSSDARLPEGVEWSDDAGAYLCNYVLFSAQRADETLHGRLSVTRLRADGAPLGAQTLRTSAARSSVFSTVGVS